MNVIFCVVFFFGLLGNAVDAEQAKESSQTIDHPHKNEYASSVVGSDKHKYGYELKENRHFHHTTTEEDGVRLGCYGYVLFGKKYSTQYVADIKGYRPVYTHDLITVYPKSGGERKASFVGDFNEDQERSENIRYFFPDGCKGSDIMVPLGVNFPIPPETKIVLKTEDPIKPPKTVSPAKNPSGPQIPKDPSGLKIPKNPSGPKIQKSPIVPELSIDPLTPPPKSPVTTPINPPPKINPNPPPTTPRTTPSSTTPRLPSQQIVTKIPAPPAQPSTVSKIVPPPKEKDVCQSTCCGDDESMAKLVVPIPLKSDGKSGSCAKFAKLIIPVEGLNPESLKSLTKDGTDTSEIIKTVLQSLF